MVVGVALSPFSGTMAAAGLSPALGLFLPVQREVEGLYSDALSLVQYHPVVSILLPLT